MRWCQASLPQRSEKRQRGREEESEERRRGRGRTRGTTGRREREGRERLKEATLHIACTLVEVRLPRANRGASPSRSSLSPEGEPRGLALSLLPLPRPLSSSLVLSHPLSSSPSLSLSGNRTHHFQEREGEAPRFGGHAGDSSETASRKGSSTCQKRETGIFPMVGRKWCKTCRPLNRSERTQGRHPTAHPTANPPVLL